MAKVYRIHKNGGHADAFAWDVFAEQMEAASRPYGPGKDVGFVVKAARATARKFREDDPCRDARCPDCAPTAEDNCAEVIKL